MGEIRGAGQLLGSPLGLGRPDGRYFGKFLQVTGGAGELAGDLLELRSVSSLARCRPSCPPFLTHVLRHLLCFSLFWHAPDIIWTGVLTLVYLMRAR
jgi:hypothetical protein